MALIGENLWYLKSIQTSASHGSAGKQNRQNLCCKCYNLLLYLLRANFIFKLLETISCYAISPLTRRYGTYFHKKEEPRKKKRLLSLLLAMAMIVSMVPFQALAEEPDETPALLETAEGIAPEDETTEVTIPETTEETVPETTEETVPETTEETVPETTEETAPETTEELVPETTEETISEVLEETVPELSDENQERRSQD